MKRPSAFDSQIARFVGLRGFGGFMAFWGASHGLKPRYVASVKATGANHMRCWYSATWDGSQYVISDAQRRVMSSVMPSAARAKVAVVVAIGFQQPAEDMPWGSKQKTASYVALVAQVASWHRGHSAVVGIDLMNEPVTREPQAHPGGWSAEQFQQVHDDWRALAIHCSVALHAAAPKMLSIYQVGLGGDPGAFSHSLPIELPWVVHSAHVYHPHSYTHQNVQAIVAGREPEEWVGYTAADSAVLHASLNTLAAWSDRHGLPVYVGETSAIQKAPGSADYVRDVTSFCNHRGWPWVYHEWSGWPGWHPNADTLAVLQAAFRKR